MNADKHFHASSVWNTKWWVGECKKCPQLWRKAAQNEKENMDNGNGTRGRLCDECIGRGDDRSDDRNSHGSSDRGCSCNSHWLFKGTDIYGTCLTDAEGKGR